MIEQLVHLLHRIVAAERKKRSRMLEITVHQRVAGIRAAASARITITSRACAEELEQRSKEWLALAKRLMVETALPWSQSTSHAVESALRKELDTDMERMLDKMASVRVSQRAVSRQDRSSPPELLDAKDYGESIIAAELELLVLRQESIRIPLAERLSAPRYAAVASSWSKAHQAYSASPPDYRQSVLAVIGAVEQLARTVLADHSLTLGAAIKELQRLLLVPKPVLKNLEELWGWSSNAPGVRHGASVNDSVDAGVAAYVIRMGEGAISLLLERDQV